MNDLVLCSVQADVATLTLNEPRKLNALSIAMIAALQAALQQLAAMPELRAVVVTGAGGRAFIGGANVHDMAGLDAASGRRFIESVHAVCGAIRALPVPVLARVDGYALGGGLEIAAACDLRLASTRSVFGMPEVRLGLPSVIETVLLPGLIGWGRTRLLVYTARQIDARTANDWGLVEEVAEADALDAAVQRCLDEITASDRDVIADQKRLLLRWEAMTPEQGIACSIDAFEATWRRPEPGLRIGALAARMRR